MNTFRCRTIKPEVSDWFEISAECPEWAANEFHSDRLNGLESLTYWLEREGRLERVHFALIEVEGHLETISRVYSTGIFRRGGVKNRLSLEHIAKELGWSHPPEQLLDEGWDGEESYK